MSDKVKYYLNNFETYVAAILFAIIGILLAVQVFSRYVLNHSFSWTEELGTLLFVPMIYCGIASAVTNRKHVSIEIVQQLVPYKVRKALLILSDVIFLVFCIYIQGPLYTVIENLGDSVTDLMRIPKTYIYIWIPIILLLRGVRIIQDIWRLWHETEENMGYSDPTIDLEACEREAKEKGVI
ncbi:MAG: TRAP transporter small permease [Lachnospiraceae bacterium]|nr:TRAP transporter small permease [Lachnospiraceae bacterium]